MDGGEVGERLVTEAAAGVVVAADVVVRRGVNVAEAAVALSPAAFAPSSRTAQEKSPLAERLDGHRAVGGAWERYDEIYARTWVSVPRTTNKVDWCSLRISRCACTRRRNSC